jgi:DNA-binding NarL/FixJ family response regulator
MELTHVVILHSNRLFRESLAAVLRDYTQILRTAVRVSEIDVTANENQPDVVLLGGYLSLYEQRREARNVRFLYPRAKIILLGVREIESEIIACFEEGYCSGYLLEDAGLEQLLDNMRAVMVGEMICTPRAAAFLAARLGHHRHENRRDERSELLTTRERQVINFIEAGLSNKEIANQLHIEVQTVKNHVHSILGKLQLNDRRQVAQYAQHQGLKNEIVQ